MEQSTHLSSQEINYLEMWNNFQGIWKQLPQEKEREDYEAISWKPQTTKNPPQEKKKAIRRSFVSVKETESIVKNLPEKKSPSPHGFIGQFYQTLWEELTPPLRSLFRKTERRDNPQFILGSQCYGNAPRQRQEKKYTDEGSANCL